MIGYIVTHISNGEIDERSPRSRQSETQSIEVKLDNGEIYSVAVVYRGGSSNRDEEVEAEFEMGDEPDDENIRDQILEDIESGMFR